MRTGVRGIAVAAAMVAALTGCGGDGDATEAVTGTGGGEEKYQPAALDATGLINALPLSSDFSSGTYSGGDAELVPEAEAAEFCSKKMEDVDCAGVKGAGIKDLALVGSSSEKTATFTLYGFGTEAQATAVLKAVEKVRKTSQGEAGPFTPVKVETGADETFAFERDEYVGVYMRVGTVVSYVSTYRFGPEQAQSAAQVQLGRLQVVAAGGDPDA